MSTYVKSTKIEKIKIKLNRKIREKEREERICFKWREFVSIFNADALDKLKILWSFNVKL